MNNVNNNKNNKVIFIILFLIIISACIFFYFKFIKSSGDNKEKNTSQNQIVVATKFEAKVHVYSTEEGGRITPFYENYRPQFGFSEAEVSGIITFIDDRENVKPGEDLNFNVELQKPTSMKQGDEFTFFEGGRKVGKGVVARVIE